MLCDLSTWNSHGARYSFTVATDGVRCCRARRDGQSWLRRAEASRDLVRRDRIQRQWALWAPLTGALQVDQQPTEHVRLAG
jgi:hypothetical protein